MKDRIIEQLKMEIESNEIGIEKYLKDIKALGKKVNLRKSENNELKRLLEHLERFKVEVEVVNAKNPCPLQNFLTEMGPFIKNKEIAIKMFYDLGKFNVVDLYIEEHKKQRDHPNFGKCGKIGSIRSDIFNSGLIWEKTSQGFDFWHKVDVGV